MRNLLKKKVALVVVAAVLACAVAIPGVIAYLTDNEFHVNSGNISPVKVEVVEDYEPPRIADYVPGGTVEFKKTISATNAGEADCYIRMALEFSDDKMAASSLLSPDGTNWYTVAEFKNHLPEGWIYLDDAELGGPYYYYTGIVRAVSKDAGGNIVRRAESTPVLLQRVRTTLSTDSPANYYDIYAYAEAVQTLSNTGERLTGTDAALNTWRSFLKNRPAD